MIGAGLALVAAVAAVFVLFGSSSSPAFDPLAQAATASSVAPGFRMDMTLLITSPQLGGPISATAHAVADLPDHAFSMSLALDMSQVPNAVQELGSPTMHMGEVLSGQNLYIGFPQVLVDRLPSLGGKPWIEMNLGQAVGLPGLSSLDDDPNASDPSEMLQELRAGASEVVNEGQQQIDGVQTTHYRAVLSVDRLLSKVPAADRELLQRTVQGEIPVDVWVDGRHLVRRMDMFLALGGQNGASVEETISANFSDYGLQPRPTPPPADQVTRLSSLAGLSS